MKTISATPIILTGMPLPRSISFIIPVRNDAARLERCLSSIASNVVTSTAVQVIVVDNGSTDASAEVGARAGAQVLVRPGLSVAQLRNEAADHATGAVLAFVDADHEIGEGWVAVALQGLAETEAAGIGALCHAPSPGTWVQRTYDRLRRHDASLAEVEWLGAGNLAIRRDVFTIVNGFDTRLETCEDVDLCNRLRARGFRLINEPRMYNVHHGDPASLRQLFLGELWRGRDNLRVTLRGPLTFRSVPSIAVPLSHWASAVIGFVAAVWTGSLSWLLLPLVTFAAATSLRSARMMGGAFSFRVLPQIACVAAVYEAARSMALVARAGHSARRDERR